MADWELIEKFIVEAYGRSAAYKGRERWYWQFVANPFRSTLISVWIALDEGNVVGQIAVQPTIVQIENVEYPAGWIVDVMVLPAHRGRSLGHKLHAAVAAEMPLLATLTMAPAMRRMALRAGSVSLGSVHEFTKLIHLRRDTVRRYLLTRAANRLQIRRLVQVACSVFRLDRLMTFMVNGFLHLTGTGQIQSGQGAVEIAEVERFEDELDCFWNNARSEYPAIFTRSARFLNWRFVSAPDLRYRCFVARRANQLIGYLVIRRTLAVELPTGRIVDFLVYRSDLEAIECLVKHAIGALGNEVDFIDCGTSAPEIVAILRRFGFVRTRTERPTIVCQDPELRRRMQELDGKWYFTKGDQDWDQVFVS